MSGHVALYPNCRDVVCKHQHYALFSGPQLLACLLSVLVYCDYIHESDHANKDFIVPESIPCNVGTAIQGLKRLGYFVGGH